ncbi:MAG: NAD(P)/FAD-dependent oxidoreductase [bacterium]|nr:NAD(P)/FAD-dependent oxidoreductase [bacterium]
MVGCGPAGATAAKVAAARGLHVMIVDRRRSVGMPPRCGGYVPQWLRARTAFDDGAVLQEVDGIRLVTPRNIAEVRAPGFILDRTRFDKTLAIQALEAGADLANALVLHRSGGRLVLRRNGLEAELEAEVVLGADGPGSIIGRSIGQANCRFLATMQYEVGLRGHETWSEFHHPVENVEGCGWFVPCGRTARIGVGLPRDRARFLKVYLDRFLRRFVADGRVYADGILSCTGGPVPVNGPLASTQVGRVLLAGAAGGLADPFNGSGIAAAVVSGEEAGRFAGEALGNGTLEALSEYPGQVRRRIPEGVGDGAGDFGQLRDRLEATAAWRGE